MGKLQELKLSENTITKIPSWIGKLEFLQSLDISDNPTLARLDRAIAMIKLTDFDCHRCYNLIEPPYAVCEGGLP